MVIKSWLSSHPVMIPTSMLSILPFFSLTDLKLNEMRCFIIIILLNSAACRLAIPRNYAIPLPQPPADEPLWALPQDEKIRIRPRARAIQPQQAIPAEYVPSSDPAMAIPSAADSVPTFNEDNATTKC